MKQSELLALLRNTGVELRGETVREQFASLLDSGAMPEGYGLVKDGPFDIWWTTRHGQLMRRGRGQPPFQFYEEREARSFCWVEAFIERGEPRNLSILVRRRRTPVCRT